jgi:DMATS type aromatic prenyltransferase
MSPGLLSTTSSSEADTTHALSPHKRPEELLMHDHNPAKISKLGDQTIDTDAQLRIYNAITRFMPMESEDESFWWSLVGRHVGIMMHEADYSVERQIQLLLFHRYRIIPYLGRRPASPIPWFKSRVAPGAGDGTPIGYSWKWSIGGGKPTIRHYMEPLGPLTGTQADPLNEVAPKQFLMQLAADFPSTDLSAFWKYAEHLRPFASDAHTRQKYIASAVLLGLEMDAESDRVDVMAGLIVKVPDQVHKLLPTIIPAALRDVYGEDVCLDSLHAAREFIDNDCHLSVNGTMAVDCISKEKSRFKFYTMNTGTSFDHIASAMTLGGRKAVSQTTLDQLRELWYGLKGLPLDFPTSSEVPSTDVAHCANGGGAQPGNASGLSFYFDLQPKLSLPDVKMQVDLSKHVANDWAAATVIVEFLRRRGHDRYAQSYLNVLQSMVPIEELNSMRGVLAYFSFSIKNDDIEIKSYFNPQAYRRFYSFKDSRSDSFSTTRSRRSRFE